MRHNFPSEAAHNTPSHTLRLTGPPHALTCYAWSGSPQPHPEEDSSPSRHCAWRSVITELGWPPRRRHGPGFRRATCGPLLRVAGTASSLESVASKVCTQAAFCTFRQALLCSASRDRALVCSGASCFRRHPGQVINLSMGTIVPAVPAASCLDLAVSASASGTRSRRSSVRVVSALASAYDTRSCSCSRCVLAVCLVVAHPAPRPVAAREYAHGEALRKVLCSPSCSSRAAPVALITKSSRLTVLCTLSP